MLSQVGAIPRMSWVTEGLTRSSARENSERSNRTAESLSRRRERFGRYMWLERVVPRSGAGKSRPGKWLVNTIY